MQHQEFTPNQRVCFYAGKKQAIGFFVKTLESGLHKIEVKIASKGIKTGTYLANASEVYPG